MQEPRRARYHNQKIGLSGSTIKAFPRSDTLVHAEANKGPIFSISNRQPNDKGPKITKQLGQHKVIENKAKFSIKSVKKI